MRGDRRQFLSTVSDRRAPTLGIPNPQHYLRPARPTHYPSHTPYTHSDARRELEHSLETPRTPDYPHLIRSKHLKTHQNGRRQETRRQEARRQEAHGEEARRQEARGEEAGQEVDALIAFKTSRATTRDDRPLFPNPTSPARKQASTYEYTPST